jgi:hypothetical protein
VDADAALAILESSLGIGLLFTDIHMRCMSVGRQSRSCWCPGN